jgi:hypothetical protein
MSPIHTPITSVDRKLHRVVLISEPDYFKNAISLAREIAGRQLTEFSYQRENKLKYATASSITRFVTYAREVGLLDENLACTQPKDDVRSVDNFQWWLRNQVMNYLEAHHACLDHIKSATLVLLTDIPYSLPTPVRVHDALETSIPLSSFRLSLNVISSLSPKALLFSSRKLVIHPEIIKG